MPSDLDRLEKTVDDLNRRFDEFMESADKRDDTWAELEADIRLVLLVLKGNGLTKDPGMFGKQIELEARVTKLERWKDRVVYLIAGIGFGSGGLLFYIIDKIFSYKK